MSKDIEKMTKSVKTESADPKAKAQETTKTAAPAEKSALGKMLEEAFPDLFDKHLQGGFEDVTKQGMTLREARRILQFEVNGPPPSKQNIMDNFRLLSSRESTTRTWAGRLFCRPRSTRPKRSC